MMLESFPFFIVQMPYQSYSMPSKIFDSSIEAEILRIRKTATESDNFKSSH